MIELQNVSKTYKGTTALAPTDIVFAAGKNTVLIGPSGCGKSTMLRLINGLISPSTGSILIHNEPIGVGSLLGHRRRMGYVIQEGGLFPHLNAQENVALLARHLQTANDTIAKRIEELCQLTHFDRSLLSRFPSELSGGQRQRVSLMRALMLDPDILLLDEPLGALDPMVRASLQTELKHICVTLHKTVVLVTHDLAEAVYFADRIILMDRGSIIQAGSFAELQSRPASEFVTAFIAAQRSLTQV